MKIKHIKVTGKTTKQDKSSSKSYDSSPKSNPLSTLKQKLKNLKSKTGKKVEKDSSTKNIRTRKTKLDETKVKPRSIEIKDEVEELPFFKRIEKALNRSWGLGKEKEYFMENFAMLITAGTDILSAIDAIKVDIKNKQFLETLEKFRKHIDAGFSVSASMERTKILAPYMVALLKIGEKTSQLTENLNIVVEQQRKNKEFKSKIRSALMYPALILTISVVVGVVITWFILPNLTGIFGSLDLELPLVTRIVIGFGNFISEYGVIVMPGTIVLMMIVFYMLFINYKTKHIGEKITFKIPGLNQLIKEIELSRFGFLLGSLLKAGVPVLTAIEALIEVADYKTYRAFYEFLYDRIEEGKSFREAFYLYGSKTDLIFPITFQQLIVSAEQSGKLADALVDASSRYESNIDNSSKNLTVLMEPILLVIIWAGVLFLALAIILPIYSLVGGVNEANNPTAQAPAVAEPTAVPIVFNEILEITSTPDETNNINVYVAPDLNSTVAARVSIGESFEFDEESGDFYRILLRRAGLPESAWIQKAHVNVLDTNEN